jgi:branched-chain amino acid transport system substrate-binding protein
MAGTAGAALGVGAGLGGLLAACHGGASTTATESTTTAATAGGGETGTSIGEQTTTTVAAGPEQGEEIRCGYVLPTTRTSAGHEEAVPWAIDWFNKNVWETGMVLGDGKLHPITILVKEARSDHNAAAELASDLVSNAEVNLIGASGGSANVVAVRDTAEALGCPCITYDCLGDIWSDGQPEGGFDWCWHTWFPLKDLAVNYVDIWDQIPTNKKVGTLFPDNAEGMAYGAGLPPAWESAGYATVDGGRVDEGREDFSSVISLFEDEGVELFVGALSPPGFVTFWEQAVSQGLEVKVSTQSGALILPSEVEALGDLGSGQSVETWFHPEFPFTSDVTGLSARQVAAQFSADSGRQWTQSLGLFGQFEIWADILRRCSDPTEKSAIVAAVEQTNLTTVGGPVNWIENPDPHSGWWNFARKPVTGGQWVKGTGKYPYDLQIVTNATDSDIPIQGAPTEIVHA